MYSETYRFTPRTAPPRGLSRYAHWIMLAVCVLMMAGLCYVSTQRIKIEDPPVREEPVQRPVDLHFAPPRPHGAW